MIRIPLRCHAVIVALALLASMISPATHGAVVTHYEMNDPTPLAESTPGADPDRPDLTNPGGGASPSHLPAGGVGGSGAYQFDGNTDYLGFASNGYTFFANGNTPSDWTVSFWIKTTETGSYPVGADFGGDNATGYSGAAQVPVLGDVTNNIGFALGVDGGTAAYRHYSAGWVREGGSINVADGAGHFVTFVYDNAGLLDIYVDGVADVTDAAVPTSGYNFLARDLGRTYGALGTPHYGEFTVDDIRVYDTALTQAEILDELDIPEPAGTTLLVALAGAVGCRRGRRN